MDLPGSAEKIQSFHPEPRRRGTVGLLSSCFLTLTLCIWSSIHPNVPGANRRWYGRIGVKASWMVMALFAPEMVLFMAYKQYTAARDLTSRISRGEQAAELEINSPFPAIVRGWRNTRRFIRKVWARLRCAFETKSLQRCCNECSQDDIESKIAPSEWTNSHSFLLAMGGLAFSTHDESGARFTSKHDLLRITVKGARCIMETEDRDLLLGISKKQIEDKSKTNRFVKFLVIAQTAIFVAQCIARLVQGLGLTPIEMNTSMHVICAIIMNALWWYKPFDVQIPFIISGERAARLAALLYGIEFDRTSDQDIEEFFSALENSKAESYFSLPADPVRHDQSPIVIINHLDDRGSQTPAEFTTVERPAHSRTSIPGTSGPQMITVGVSQSSRRRRRNTSLYLDDHEHSFARRAHNSGAPPIGRRFPSLERGSPRERDQRPVDITIPEESEPTPPSRDARPLGSFSADSADPDTIFTRLSNRTSAKNALVSPSPSTITLVGSDKPALGDTISSVLNFDSPSEKEKPATGSHTASEECPRAQELKRDLTMRAIRHYDHATKQRLKDILYEEDEEGPVVENEVKDLEVFSFLKATYRDKKERWNLFYHPVFGLFTVVYGAAHLIIIYCQKPPLLRTGVEMFLWKFSAGLITTTTGALYTFEFIVPFFFNPIGDLVVYSWKKVSVPLEGLLKRLAHDDEDGQPETDHSRFIRWGLKKLRSWSVIEGPVTIQDYYSKLFSKLEAKLTDSSRVTKFINTGLVLFLVTVFALCRFYLIFECLYTVPNLPDKFYERPTFGGLPFF